LGVEGHPGQLLFVGFEGTEAPAELVDRVRAGSVGGVVLFARNLESPEQVRALTTELHAAAPSEAPLVVSIDQEGGRVQRLPEPWTRWPSMREAARGGPAEVERVGAAIGLELSDAGIDLDFAPVVDVATNPANDVIGDRSFGGDPETVGELGAALIRGLQSSGVAACAKHVPGHGDTVEDSHHALPVLDHDRARLEAVELPPFAAAVGAGVASLLTAHVLLPRLDPDAPATLSPVLRELIREGLGFEGVVFSDDLDMAAVAERFTPAEIVERAAASGVDVLLACRDPERQRALADALEQAPRASLEASLSRVRELKRRWVGGARSQDSQGPPYAAHLRLAATLAP